MSLDNVQIFKLAKEGRSAAEIAEALDYDLDAVTFVLKDNAVIEKAVTDAPTNKLDAEFQALESLALSVFKQVLEDGEVKASVRLNAACYVTDQRLGLKAPKSNINVFNIVDFNERMLEVKRRRAEIDSIPIESSSKLVAA